MGAGLLVAIDPAEILRPNPEGLTLGQVAYFGQTLIEVTPENFESTLEFLRNNFSKLAIYLDVRKLKSWDSVVDVLNNGASKIFVTFEQLKTLSQEQTISPDRLVLTISLINPKD